MSALVKVYFEELAQGNVPSESAPETIAYKKWSRNHEAERIVRASCLSVYGSDYYLLGSYV